MITITKRERERERKTIGIYWFFVKVEHWGAEELLPLHQNLTGGRAIIRRRRVIKAWHSRHVQHSISPLFLGKPRLRQPSSLFRPTTTLDLSPTRHNPLHVILTQWSYQKGLTIRTGFHLCLFLSVLIRDDAGETQSCFVRMWEWCGLYRTEKYELVRWLVTRGSCYQIYWMTSLYASAVYSVSNTPSVPF